MSSVIKVKDMIKFLKGCDPNAEIVTPVYTGADEHLLPACEAQEFRKGQSIGAQEVNWAGRNCYLTENYQAGRKIVLIHFAFKNTETP